MERALKFIAGSLPLIFAFALLVPVIDQAMQAFDFPTSLGLSRLAFALIVGGGWGLFAMVSGRWI